MSSPSPPPTSTWREPHSTALSLIGTHSAVRDRMPFWSLMRVFHAPVMSVYSSTLTTLAQPGLPRTVYRPLTTSTVEPNALLPIVCTLSSCVPRLPLIGPSGSPVQVAFGLAVTLALRNSIRLDVDPCWKQTETGFASVGVRLIVTGAAPPTLSTCTVHGVTSSRIARVGGDADGVPVSSVRRPPPLAAPSERTQTLRDVEVSCAVATHRCDEFTRPLTRYWPLSDGESVHELDG